MGDFGPELPAGETAGLPGCPNTTESDGDIKVLVTGFGVSLHPPLRSKLCVDCVREQAALLL